jgi:uncharacterized protein YdhG (YjbR/CyaY superfamily)
MRKKYTSVDEYLKDFDGVVKERLLTIREIIKENASEVEEKIGYNIPAYYFKGKPLIYFAGFKNHVSIFPTPGIVEEFKKEISEYKGGKGTVQFPNEKPLPLELIKKIVVFKYNLL